MMEEDIIDNLPFETALVFLMKDSKTKATRQKSKFSHNDEWLRYHATGFFTLGVGENVPGPIYRLSPEDLDAKWMVKIVPPRHNLNIRQALGWARKGEKVKRTEWRGRAVIHGGEARGFHVVNLPGRAGEAQCNGYEYSPDNYDVVAEDWYVVD